jgi:hypothetical protein
MRFWDFERVKFGFVRLSSSVFLLNLTLVI